jgi:predicted DNA-binding transcriptional regulator YafY
MQSDFISRIQQIDHLIKIKGTGTPDAFAARLGISRRSLYDYLNKMKDGGAPIKYDYFRSSFYYEEEGSFRIDFSFCKSQVSNHIKSVAGYSSFIFLTQLMQVL